MPTTAETIINLYHPRNRPAPGHRKAWETLVLEHLFILRHPPYGLSDSTVASMVTGAISVATDGSHLMRVWDLMCQVADDANGEGYRRGYSTAQCDAMDTSGY